MFHKAELEVVPAGIKKGYPRQIDFDALPQRIAKFEQQLRHIIKGKTPSKYQELVKSAFDESGKKAATPMGVWGRFESLQVIYYKYDHFCLILAKSN